jgi:hypothetical protein
VALRTTGEHSGGRLWAVLTLITAIGAALLPLISEPRYYFFGDTQIGAFGQWYHLGQELRSGHWPLLDPQVWAAGNFVAEGQWGLFSPLTVLIGLLATMTPNAVVLATIVKICLLSAGSLGTYALARSYRATPPAAYVAGLASGLGGATLYLESPSWVTGQMVWALLPLFWWQLRRVAAPLDDRSTGAARWASPAAVLVLGWLIVSVGYVYGTLYIIIVGVATIIDCGLARQWAGALRVVGVGVFCGLLAVTVYLPGVLTAPVTTRLGFEIISDGRLQGTVSGVLSSMLPFTDNGRPTAYIAWFLPLLAWVHLDRLRVVLRDLVGLLLVLLVMLMWLLGPNQVGPIRWPLRVLPIVTLLVVLALMVILSRAGTWRPSVARLVAALGIAFVAGYLTVSRAWESRSLIALGTASVLVGLAITWGILRVRARTADAPPGPPESDRPEADLPERAAPPRRVGAALAFVGLWSVAVLALQLHAFPTPASQDRNMPSAMSDYATPASQAEGDTIAIGNIEKVLVADPAASRDFLMANSWYLSPKDVQSTYTTIGYETYTKRFCVLYSGNLCPRGLTALLETDPGTGAVRADLLSVSSLQLLRKDFAARRLDNPPTGWHVAHRSPYAVTWVRDRALPRAGGVTWTSDGVRVTEQGRDTRSVTFTVDAVPSNGGRVVLSRLQWPGYTVSGATLSDPTDGYLTTVAVTPGTVGRQVTVSFSPPGWTIELTTLAAATLLAVGWVVLAGIRRRRARPGGDSDSRGVPDAGAPGEASASSPADSASAPAKEGDTPAGSASTPAEEGGAPAPEQSAPAQL